MTKVLEIDKPTRLKVVSKIAPNNCECGSWLEHWKRLTHRVPVACHIQGCEHHASVGVHVLRMNEAHRAIKKNHYILPMCEFHAEQKGQILMSKSGVYLAWANVRYTCQANVKLCEET